MKHFETIDSVMERAIELACSGRGFVEPNPMVGAVIVDDHLNLISEGYHKIFGGPHAEIDALNKIDQEIINSKTEGMTLFITLEPCCHQGKTGPCTQAIIKAGIKKVYIGIQDPAPHVNGNGITELENAGIEVHTSIKENEVRKMMAPFIRMNEKGLPYVHAKWAMTLDGKIASKTGHSQWISNQKSRELVHIIRGQMDAIIIGIETVLKDDPLLTARPEGPRTATRIVIDRDGQLPIDSQLVKTTDQAPVMLVTSQKTKTDHTEELKDQGVEILVVPFKAGSTTHLDLKILCEELARREMTNILVEGGGGILGSFFDEKLINEIHVFIAGKLVGGKKAITPLAGNGLEKIPELPQLSSQEVQLIENDVYIHGQVDLDTT
jgi:diaminohydroxyphosphoribosylaminopyrimidine deaminase / 5-amino-6-(5-phosphoribosylamino)uracil reductase